MIKRKSSEAVHYLKELLKHCDRNNRVYLMQMYQNIIKIDSQYKQQISIHEFLRELFPENL
jgi:flagellar motor switch protein FliM